MADLAQLNISLVTTGAEQAASALAATSGALARTESATKQLMASLSRMDGQLQTLNSIKNITNNLQTLNAQMSSFNGADTLTRQFNALVQSANISQGKIGEFKNAITALQQSFSNSAVSGNTNSLIQSIKQLDDVLGKMSVSRMSALGQSSGLNSNQIMALRQELDRLAGSAVASANQINRAFSSFDTRSTTQLNNEIQKIQRNLELIKPHVTASDFAKFQAEASNKIKTLHGDLQNAEKASHGFGAAFMKVAKYTSAYDLFTGIKQLAVNIYEVNVKMEGLRKGFEGAFGSAAAGASQFEYAMNAADKYGKSIDSVANSYKKFTITSDYMGMSTEKSRRVFESVSEAVTKVGGTSDDVAGTLTALIQMMSKGTVSAEEFRQQFAERIPGAMKMGADALGVTTYEFKKLMAEGKIVSSEFIPKLADQLKIFAVGWETAATSISAVTERLKNNLSQLFESRVLQEGAAGILGSMADLTGYLNKQAKMVDLYNDFKSKVTQGLVKAGDFELKGSFKYEEFQKWIAEWNKASIEEKLKDTQQALEDLYKKRDDLEKRGAPDSSDVRVGNRGLEEYRKEVEQTNKGIKEDSDNILKMNVTKVTSEVNLLQAAFNRTRDSANLDFGNIDKHKALEKARDTLEHGLNEQLRIAQDLVKNEINVDVNTKKVDEIKKTLELIVGKPWYALLTVGVDAKSLEAVMNTYREMLAKTAEGKLSKGKEDLAGIIATSQMLKNELAGFTKKDLTEEDRVAKQKDLNGLLLLEMHTRVEIAEQERKASRENTAYFELMQKYGSKEPTVKFGEYSKADKRKMEFDVDYQAEYKKYADAAFSPDAYKTFQSQTKGLSDNLHKQLADLAKADDDAADAAKRHALAVENLNEATGDYFRKEFALANDDSLGAKFVDIDKKARELINTAQKLAVEGGVSIEEVTARVGESVKMAREYASANALEALFPYLKQDDKVTSFWSSVYSQNQDGFKGLIAAAKKAGISYEEVMERMTNASIASKMKQNLDALKDKLNSALDLSSFMKASQAVALMEVAPQQTEERKLWGEIADAYNTTSKEMAEAREAMYARIIEAAQGSAKQEQIALAVVQKDREDHAKKELEVIQQVGSAQDAFFARMAQNYETYKSESTKAREEAIKLADSIKSATDSLAEGIGQSFGDMIRGIGEDTFKVEDMMKNMRSRMLDIVANSVETMVTDHFKSVFSGAMKFLLPGSAETPDTAASPESHPNSTFDASSFNTATFSGAVFNDVQLPAGNSSGSSTASSTPTNSDSNFSSSTGKITIMDTVDVAKFGTTAGTAIVSGLSSQGTIVGSASTINKLGTVASLLEKTTTLGTGQNTNTDTAAAAATAAASASSAIWAKNNNPGNLRDISGAWQKFETMQDGVNSMTSYVENKVGKGYDTIAKLGKIYAEDSQLWKDNVSKISGIAKNDTLDVSNQSQIAQLIKGITTAEGSGKAVTASMITTAVEKAASGVNSYSGKGNNSSGNSSVIDNDLLKGMLNSDTILSDPNDPSSYKPLGKAIGDSAGKSLVAEMFDSSSSGTFIGDADSLMGAFADGIDMSKLGSSNWLSNWDSISPATQASTYTGQQSSGTNWKSIAGGAMGAASGVMQVANAQNAGQAIGGVLSTVGSIASIIPGGQLIGGIATIAGGLISAFSTETKKEIKKVASGYNVGYSGGHATSYGVDFYNDGSVQATGASDPDVQKKIADSFRETAESLSDFAEELGFAVDVLEGFEMPNMNVTSDQLDGYIRNGENMMAFKGLMEAGLRGAFDYVARDGEVYVDEYERLATSLSTVRGGLEAYGYELSDVAMITQEEIDAIRVKNTEVAEGTAAAMAAMATSMGATSDVIAQIAEDTPDATAALAATDEQLSSILEADYASDLLDAVGGEDAFNSMMGNLTKNIFNTVDAYGENLGYYTEKATTYIAKLDQAGVTINNFWEKFDEAIKNGLTVDEFEAWGKASTWVNQIDSVTEALENWSDSMKKAGQSLDVRELQALGQSDLASYTQALNAAEWELADAREANYDIAVLNRIEEVQALELAKQEYELSKKKWSITQALNVREKELNNDPYASAASAYYDNGWEYQEAADSGLYSKEDLARLKDIQEREIKKYYDEIATSTQQNAEDAYARLLRAQGDTDAADIYEAQVNGERELKEARDSGLYTLEAYANLTAALGLEMQELIESQKKEFDWTERELQVRLLSATGHTNEAETLSNLIAAEKELADAREAGYDAATIMLLELVQAAEAAKVAADQMSQATADLADLKSRSYAATGDDTMSSWTSLLEQQRQERYDALSGGKDSAYMEELDRVQALERTKEWEDLQKAAYREAQQEAIDALNDQVDALSDTLSDLQDSLEAAMETFNTAMDSIGDIISVMLSNANSAYSSASSSSDSIRSTIEEIMNGEDSVLSPSQKSSSLRGQIDTAYNQMTTAGHGEARVEAASTISELAGDYLSALQTSTNSEQYMIEYLDIMSKLREAESISGEEENYQFRIVDALEQEQRILELIREELAKDDPNTAKLQALAAASGVMGTALEGIYGDTEAAGSWRDSVEGLLASAGYSNADIIAALGGNVGSQSFLAQLSDFNSRVLGTQLPFISRTIGEIKGIEESIQRLTEQIAEMQDDVDDDDPPGIDPPPVEKYTEQQKAWAGNLSTAMNDQSYGGKTNWTANTILPDLDFYKQWGSSYGISDTAGYKVANNMVGEYLRVKTRDLNAENAGGRGDWTAVQAKTAIGSQLGYFNGDPNVLAHWLAYGYAEGYDFPTTAPIAYKTADYFRDKWEKNHYGADSPYMLAKLIAGDPGINIGFANDVLTLEAIAKKHYDTYIKGRDSSSLDPADRGLVQPYALGGFASAGSWGLVGEEGPEIVKFKSPTTITSNTASKNLLGDSFDELKDEVKRLRTELYAVCRENAANTLRLAKMADRWSEEGLKTREVSA